jgi:hypothetical protein
VYVFDPVENTNLPDGFVKLEGKDEGIEKQYIVLA